ncbi:MAG: zf-TFIIB domain-containing protein [Gemmatimonadaceae bacterium]
MNCPKCTSPMKGVSVGSVEVDRCTSCAGMWFDAFEDEAVKRARGATAVDTGNEITGKVKNQHGKISCPKCRTRTIRMVDREQPHIWYESCPVCYGKFFDAGEFKDVAEKGLKDLFRRWGAKERPLS